MTTGRIKFKIKIATEIDQGLWQLEGPEGVQTTLLYDTGSYAQARSLHVRKELGKPKLQTTNVTLGGLLGPDLGVIGIV